MSAPTDEQRILEGIAARQGVLFVSVAVEAVATLERGERFSGRIELRRDETRPGEAELLLTREEAA